jgi:hypothetical protein
MLHPKQESPVNDPSSPAPGHLLRFWSAALAGLLALTALISFTSVRITTAGERDHPAVREAEAFGLSGRTLYWYLLLHRSDPRLE